VTSTPRGNASLTLVRHGETDWNKLRLVQGQTNVARLNDEGRAQAGVAAKSLRELGFDLMVSSDLDRAAETASIIGSELGLVPELEPLLRERCFGTYESGPLAALTSDVSGIDRDVIVNPDAHPPLGESFRAVVERAERFVNLANESWPGARVLAVTHGGMVHALRAYVERAELTGLEWYRVGNCSVWSLDDYAASS
jgi:broad specificity phosphatase PhoE